MMEDIDHIVAIMAEAFEPHWGEAWTRRQIADSLLLPAIYYRLIDADGVPLNEETRDGPSQEHPAAGFILTRHVAGEEEVLLVAVTPPHRGKGLGRKLLEMLAKDAAARGAERLFLEMRSNNPAERLYHAMGFEPIGRRKGYYRLKDGSQMDAITFSLALK